MVAPFGRNFGVEPPALNSTERIFPCLCRSPSPDVGAPGNEFTFKPNFDLFDSTTPQSLRDSSPNLGSLYRLHARDF